MAAPKFLAITLLAGWIVLVAASMPAHGAARTDPLDENYLTGRLTWKDGKGSIVWEGAAETEDNVDPGRNAKGDIDEFVSAPVPRTLFLNVSRAIHLDAFFQGATFMPIDAELRAGTKFLTGGMSGHTDAIDWTNEEKNGNPRPSAPGYATATHRMHPELDTIEKGAVLTLRILHTGTARHVYGFAEDHQSVLHIPLFGPDEVLYRIPKYQNEEPPAPPPPPVPVPQPIRELLQDVVATVGGIGGLAVGLARAQRRRAILAVALLGGGAFAGCLGGGGAPGSGIAADPTLAGTATTYVISDTTNESGYTTTSTGSIVGLVSDPEALPVNGAHVLLLGTPASARTDPQGRFQFANLEPGAYRLRIDRTGFHAFEQAVDVHAASITKVEVVLLFVDVQDVNFRPHRHDYWEGKDSVVLIDQAFDGTFVMLTPPLLVIPGTVDIEVLVTWEGGGTRFLRTQRADAPVTPTGEANDTTLYRRGSGQPFHLRTTWEMTDPGHSKYTFWGAFETAVGTSCGSILDPTAVTCFASGAQENFHIKITLHKGVVPLEPSHPNFWSDRTTHGVFQNETRSLDDTCGERYVIGLRACPLGPTFTPLFPLLFLANPEQAVRGLVADRPYNASWRPSGFVPFETVWAEVTLTADRHLSVPEPTPPWKVFYRTAETPEVNARYAPNVYVAQPTCNPWTSTNADIAKTAPFVKAAGELTWTYRFLIAPAEADAPYAKRTNWCFFVAPADQNLMMLDDHTNLGARPKLTLTLIAHRDPVPA